ncbi:uncharacterized protein LOC111400126 [Olea europaea var. sylvestris]|uniref:uncharacterized protein LOC111400126 n=1 Tax=Olea europaea var. sylvestris TaxID=158386 RepID=UPI000C1D87E4|nr:uncharacterized protein LOC111400126 [Olea europaea var. sylvestris]
MAEAHSNATRQEKPGQILSFPQELGVRYRRVPAAKGGDRVSPETRALGQICEDNWDKQKVEDCPPPRARNITFNEEDLVGVAHPHDDALVIVGDIADFDIKRVLVDGGSATNVLTLDAFLGLKTSHNKLKTVNTPLQGFGGVTVILEGTMELPVTLSTYPTAVVIVTSFLIVKTPMAYNAIYGRPLLNADGAIPSTYHQVMKFPTSWGIGCVRGDQQASRKCYVDSISVKGTPSIMMLEIEPPKGCLTDNLDVFAWSPNDITRISPAIVQYRLGVLPGAKLVKQKKRKLAFERQEVVKAEVKKLLQADFIQEVQYPKWLAKIVLVKKSNEKWCMCVDYTGLNKACPKDSYPRSAF